jgi:DNA polymerase III delta prime subunit
MFRFTTLSVLFLLCFQFQSLNAQKSIIRYESSDLAEGSTPATIAEIQGANAKDVEKKWRSYLKKHDGKLSEKGDEYFLDNAKVNAISRDTLDIYSTITTSGKTIYISVAINKDGTFVTNSDGQSPSIDEFVYAFVLDIRKDMAADELKAAEKVLKTKDKAYESLVKSNRKLEKSNKKMREKIADNERQIRKNDESIDAKKREVAKQEALVKELERRLKNIE